MNRSSLPRIGHSAAMQVSTYDRVSAGLWTLTILFGVTASFGALMWVQARREKTVERDHQSELRLVPADFGTPAPVVMGVADNDPGADDFPENEKSQLAYAIEAVTNVASRQRRLLANFDGTEEDMGHGHTGPPGSIVSDNPVREVERWSIEYESEGIDDYFRQLVAFGIEIGFVSKVTDRVEIISDLSTRPRVRDTTKQTERRCYFIHSDGKLRSWDLRIALNSGVNPQGKIMVQFYPPSATVKLLQLEAREAEARGIERAKIQRTTFRVRTVGDSYEYFVADMVSN